MMVILYLLNWMYWQVQQKIFPLGESGRLAIYQDTDYGAVAVGPETKILESNNSIVLSGEGKDVLLKSSPFYHMGPFKGLGFDQVGGPEKESTFNPDKKYSVKGTNLSWKVRPDWKEESFMELSFQLRILPIIYSRKLNHLSLQPYRSVLEVMMGSRFSSTVSRYLPTMLVVVRHLIRKNWFLIWKPAKTYCF